METVCFSETLVSTYKFTPCYNPQDQHRHFHRRENLKSHDYFAHWRLTRHVIPDALQHIGISVRVFVLPCISACN
jgi:hypothetical protein